MDKVTDPNDEPWAAVHGVIQMRMAVYDRERGWVVSRNSIACVKSTVFIENEYRDEYTVDEFVSMQARALLRSIRKRWEEK